ncbi:MAG: nucleotidyltransferase family protein [Ignavibacteriae bacterium]|nr:nucleotidyltransferase family protein [Ignavibacteriota bacterium]
MENISHINSLLNQHKIDLQKKYNIKQLGVFGSYSRGDQVEESDVDILVEFEKPIGLDFVSLAEDLENILKLKVDLVSKGAIKDKVFDLIKKDLIYV